MCSSVEKNNTKQMFDKNLPFESIEDIFETDVRFGEIAKKEKQIMSAVHVEAVQLNPVRLKAARLDTAEGQATLRLTRRGRIVFGALATVLVASLLALIAVFSSPSALASDAQSTDEFSYIVVQPGESLWSVATALDPSMDPRDLVGEIVQLNKLTESGVQAGQPLAVPLRYSDSPIAVSADEVGL